MCLIVRYAQSVFVSRDVLYTVGGGDKDGAYVKDVLAFDLHERKFLPNILALASARRKRWFPRCAG